MDCANDQCSPEQLLGRYQRARALLKSAFGKDPLVLNATVLPVWIDGADVFFYKRQTRDGTQHRLVDPARQSNEPAFDHAALAASLSRAQGQAVDPADLPISEVDIQLDPRRVSFRAFEKHWRYDDDDGTCAAIPARKAGPASPDGTLIAFAQDHNLWLRDVGTGEDRALTEDGTPNHAYGAVSTAWGVPNGPETTQAVWSPDGRRILTVVRDTRRVAALPVMHYLPEEGRRPKVAFAPLSYPGDEQAEQVRLVAIDAHTGCRQEPDYEALPSTRNGYGFFDQGLGWWAADGRRAYFVDVDRYYKYARVVEFDTHTGKCTTILEERSQTHVDLMLNQDEIVYFLPLPETAELIWFSERSGWGHFYLYDLNTGDLKRPLTSGDWIARRIVRYIPEDRELYVQTAGRVAQRDPYYRDLIRIHLDTGEVSELLACDFDNAVVPAGGDLSMAFFEALHGVRHRREADCCGVSKTGAYAVVTQSRADTTPVSFVLDRDGHQVMRLEEADLSALPDGWIWPEPARAKAADGETDVYGLIFRPSDFDPTRSYPVISQTFCQPETPIVSKGAFTNGYMAGFWYYAGMALAELGFVVVQLDGRGSPVREKAFYDHSYGRMECASDIDDHVAALRHWARSRPYMDLNRVGLDAHASGGSGIWGLFKHPEFYQVGVSSMTHDVDAISAPMQGDKFNGPPRQDRPFARIDEHAAALNGKLLLLVGLLDRITAPAAAFRLASALQSANKDFDMLVDAKFGHDFSPYFTRRAWDYFVTHLAGATPPPDFRLDDDA